MTDETAGKILAGQEGLKADLRGLTAVMEARLGQAQRERTALFETKKDHAQRLGVIERKYLPRTSLQEHETVQREDFGRLTSQVDGIKIAVTRVIAIGGVILVAVQVLMNWMGK